MADTRRGSIAVLPRKTRERNAHQQEIMAAARELFAVKGYHNTTLEEIAHHAEFGKGTIYNYFVSKEDLLYGIIDRLTRDIVALAKSCMNAATGGSRDQLTAYARGMISHARDNADLFNLVLREVHHLDAERYDDKLQGIHGRARRIWTILARPIREEIRDGRMEPEDPVWLASIFDGMVRTYCMTHYGTLRLLGGGATEDPGAVLVSLFLDGATQRKRKG